MKKYAVIHSIDPIGRHVVKAVKPDGRPLLNGVYPVMGKGWTEDEAVTSFDRALKPVQGSKLT